VGAADFFAAPFFCGEMKSYSVKPDVVILSSIKPILSTMRIRPFRILKTSLNCILRRCLCNKGWRSR